MKYILSANLEHGILKAFDKEIAISCLVRNENNNRRKNEVVRSIPSQKPIQPRTFPVGTWRIDTPVARDTDYLRPFFIPTNAWQMLPVWTLDSTGSYKEVSNEVTRDEGYGLHFSTSPTTAGCIKILKKEDLLFLVEQIKPILKAGGTIYLEVS